MIIEPLESLRTEVIIFDKRPIHIEDHVLADPTSHGCVVDWPSRFHAVTIWIKVTYHVDPGFGDLFCKGMILFGDKRLEPISFPGHVVKNICNLKNDEDR